MYIVAFCWMWFGVKSLVKSFATNPWWAFIVGMSDLLEPFFLFPNLLIPCSTDPPTYLSNNRLRNSYLQIRLPPRHCGFLTLHVQLRILLHCHCTDTGTMDSHEP
jgi:hypothetical protein